jgi:Pyruvate/2-oxoacid:ferredoxin oxidoreductase delta subunit
MADEQQSGDRPIALFEDINPAYFMETPRQRAAELPVPERLKTFDEVKSDLTKQGAIQEAARCFQCGRCTLCENCYIFCSDVAVHLDTAAPSPVFTRNLCEGCGVCIHECPRGALSWDGGKGG